MRVAVLANSGIRAVKQLERYTTTWPHVSEFATTKPHFLQRNWMTTHAASGHITPKYLLTYISVHMCTAHFLFTTACRKFRTANGPHFPQQLDNGGRGISLSKPVANSFDSIVLCHKQIKNIVSFHFLNLKANPGLKIRHFRVAKSYVADLLKHDNFSLNVFIKPNSHNLTKTENGGFKAWSHSVRKTRLYFHVTHTNSFLSHPIPYFPQP